MPRDYNPDDGRFYGPMTIADIFADSVRDTIASRRAAEKDNMLAAEFQARQEEQAWENENVRPIKLAEAKLRQDTARAQLDAARFKLEHDRRTVNAGSAMAATYNAAEAEVESLLNGDAPGSTGTGAPVLPGAPAPPDSPAGDGSLFPAAITPAGPAANDPNLPTPDPAAAPDPNILLEPNQPVGPNPPAAPMPAVPAPGNPVPMPAVTPPDLSAPPVAAPPAPPADPEAQRHATNYERLRKLKALERTLPRGSPQRSRIALYEQGLMEDGGFQTWARTEADKAEVADVERTLPVAMVYSAPDKLKAFAAYHPTFNVTFDTTNADAPPVMTDAVSGKPLPAWKVKALKQAWDGFQYKPGMALPPVRSSPLPGLGGAGYVPFNAMAVPQAAALAPKPTLQELQSQGLQSLKPPAETGALPWYRQGGTVEQANQQWTQLKAIVPTVVPIDPARELPVAAAVHSSGLDALPEDLAKKLETQITGRDRPGGINGTVVMADEVARAWAADVLRKNGYLDAIGKPVQGTAVASEALKKVTGAWEK